MNEALARQLQCFAQLAQRILGVTLLHLDRQLVPSEYPDRALLPQLAGELWDEVLFGGALFRCPEKRACELDTSLGVCFTAQQLPGQDGFFVLGPYVPEAGSRFVPGQQFDRAGASEAQRAHFMRYYGELPVLGHDKLHALLAALMFEVYGAAMPEDFAQLELAEEGAPLCPVFSEDAAHVQAQVIAARYAAENAFLDGIARGEVGSLGAQQLPELHRTPNPVRNCKNLLIVLNTLLRKTIERTGVPPYLIDRISAGWAVRIERATSLAQLEAMRADLAADYARAVRQHALAHYSPNVRAMLQYAQLHLDDPGLGLRALARELGRSEGYLSRQFGRETGRSLSACLTALRVEEARRLLRGSDAPVSAVALAVGYTDLNYFTRVFHRAAGQTPTAFRAAARAKKAPDSGSAAGAQGGRGAQTAGGAQDGKGARDEKTAEAVGTAKDTARAR